LDGQVIRKKMVEDQQLATRLEGREKASADNADLCALRDKRADAETS
jgi:hypothetical protein